MSRLDELRKEIDSIDRQMAALFENRMRTVGEIAAFKRDNNLPVLDASREGAMIERNVAYLEDEAFAPYYTGFLQDMMAISRAWQTYTLGKGTVAYQGAEGSFQHQVAQKLFPYAASCCVPTFASVFEAVESGRAAYGILPFENSNTGDVAGILDLCYNHSLYITHMYDLPVQQNLLAVPGATLGDIEEVYSKQEALEQSRRFLEGLNVRLMPYLNTATAAQMVAEKGDKRLAAIASLDAAERYGLVPIAKDIATEASNTTRFIVISKEPAAEGDHFSLLVTVENKVGTLERLLGAITREGLNMESIKSRPMPGRPWEYYFYIELAGAPDAAATKDLLQKLETASVSARMLGVYKRTGG